MRQPPQPNTIWIHTKTGNKYKVITVVTTTKCGKFRAWIRSKRVIYIGLTELNADVYERYLNDFLTHFTQEQTLDENIISSRT